MNQHCTPDEGVDKAKHRKSAESARWKGRCQIRPFCPILLSPFVIPKRPISVEHQAPNCSTCSFKYCPPPPFFLLWGSLETLMALGGKIPLKERREGWLFLWGSWLAMCPGKNVRDVFELLMSSFFVCPIGLETGKRAADTLAFSMPICPFISLTPHFMVHWHCMSTESLLLMRPTAAKLYKSSTSFQQSLPNIMYVIEKEK